MDVSPHLKIRTPLAEIAFRAMWAARDNMVALYEFVAERQRPLRSSVGMIVGSPRPHAVRLQDVDSDGHADLLDDGRLPESIRPFGVRRFASGSVQASRSVAALTRATGAEILR